LVAVFLIDILAPPTTAPVGSVTVPTILPVEIVVWPKAMEERDNTDRVTTASTTNRTPEREEFSFNIVDLPFRIVLIRIFRSSQAG
jgi:hypothetical protein